jgi:hypothetical protein
MVNLFLGSFIVGAKALAMLLFSKVSVATTLLLWQHAVGFGGWQRLNSIRQTLPFLMLELRMRLNRRNWIVRLSHLALFANHRDFSPPVFSSLFLLRRDGRHILDFFKTLACSDVSPPAFA